MNPKEDAAKSCKMKNLEQMYIGEEINIMIAFGQVKVIAVTNTVSDKPERTPRIAEHRTAHWIVHGSS